MKTETLDELGARLSAAALGRIRAGLSATIERATGQLQAQAVANIDARLTPHTRQLRTSVRGELDTQAEVIVGIVRVGGEFAGLSVPYARIQEYGGTILPVNGRYLAIPVANGLTAAGTAKYPSVRMMPFAVFVPTRGGKAKFLVLDKRNKQLFFVLVPSTTLPEKRYLRDAADTIRATLPSDVLVDAVAALGDA